MEVWRIVHKQIGKIMGWLSSNTEQLKKVEEDRQKSLQGAVNVLDKQKKDNITAAMQNPGFCAIIGIAIVIGIVGLPALGMIVLFA